MARPLWFVNLIEKTFPNIKLIAKNLVKIKSEGGIDYNGTLFIRINDKSIKFFDFTVSTANNIHELKQWMIFLATSSLKKITSKDIKELSK